MKSRLHSLGTALTFGQKTFTQKLSGAQIIMRTRKKELALYVICLKSTMKSPERPQLMT